MIGLFSSGAIASQGAKNITKILGQPFEELQGSNLEFRPITPKIITRSYFDNNLIKFSLASLHSVAI